MLFLLLACQDEVPKTNPGLDTSVRLEAGQVRAGTVQDPIALIGGISAEGQVGDIKIYNSNVQFIVQRVTDSGFYVEYGGMVIDADIVREPGQPGRDILDELGPMVGLARMVDATKVSVIQDGSNGTATVRVEGPGAPLLLATGALENPGLVPELDLWVQTDYTLSADSHLLSVTTTVTNRESSAQTLAIGDVGFLATEVIDRFSPVTGFEEATSDERPWTLMVGKRNEVALALMGADTPLSSGTAGTLLEAIGPVVAGFGPNEEIAAGGTGSWTRFLGVAADPATLTAEWASKTGAPTVAKSGTVTAGGLPVAGARVFALDVSGAPIALAFTGSDGSYAVQFPSDTAGVVVSGVGNDNLFDLPAGHGWYSPYDPNRSTALSLLTQENTFSFADGYGFSTISELTAPGTLTLSVTDKKPAIVRITPTDTVTSLDRRFVPNDGRSRTLFVRDGDQSIPLPPGDYHVVAYRGVRDELYTQEITIESSKTTNVSAEILPAYSLSDVITGDPHSHASPSGDGDISMEYRLMSMAANGIDVHFGTDHDHSVDYRVLLAPLGLDGVLSSIVADETSPVLRGHFNNWPVNLDESKPNGGAWRWWQGYADTAEIFAAMRAQLTDGVIQANHPVGGSGMFTAGDFDPNTGVVGKSTHWSSDFDAMELLNSGDYSDYLASYLSLINHGHLIAPLGVSDSHGASSGQLGASLTFFHTNGQTTPEALVDAVRRRATVVSRGPYIDARVNNEFAPGNIVSGDTSITVIVYAPSWMPVDTVSLYQDGVVVESLPCEGVSPTPCSATWALDPSQDASFVIGAESSRPMVEAHAGLTAWAMTSAILVDVSGDGWQAPLPALVIP